MAFKIITQDDQDEIMYQFLEAQERDLYCFQINLERYEKILQGSPSPEFKARIEKLKAETQSRIEEVQSIIDASEDQIPPEARLTAAKTRITEKLANTPIR